MHRPITRRRTIAILAAAAGLPLLLKARGSQAREIRWDGTALGAPATITLYHEDERAARAAISEAVAELQRLEAVFSLYRADSAIAALNRDGRLAAAPAELVELLAEARHWAEVTAGAFDPTVQPLWQVYFRHFTAAAAPAGGPSDDDIARARDLVDWRGIAIDPERRSIHLARPGMAVTLNGIAQGYITDRVAGTLRANGLARTLVNMGEQRGFGGHPDGAPWRIGVAHPADPARTVATLELRDGAVATSGGYGTVFDGEGRFTHLIDPATGRTAPALQGVTVVAGTAAKADALSTALSVAPEARRAAIVAAAGIEALFVDADGRVTRLAA